MKTCECCGQIIPEDYGFAIDEECDVVLYNNQVFPITPLMARLFIGLYSRRPRFVPEWVLFDDLYGLEAEDDQPTRKTLNVYMSKLRKELLHTPLMIENASRRGWRLAPREQEPIRWV